MELFQGGSYLLRVQRILSRSFHEGFPGNSPLSLLHVRFDGLADETIYRTLLASAHSFELPTQIVGQVHGNMHQLQDIVSLCTRASISKELMPKSIAERGLRTRSGTGILQ